MLLNWLNFQAQNFSAQEPTVIPEPPKEPLTPKSVILTVLDANTPRTLSELYDALKQVQLGVGYPALIAIVNSLITAGEVRRDSREDGVQLYFKAKSRTF